MDEMISLLSVSIVFWGAIFFYVVWLDRKIVTLKKRMKAFEEMN